MPARAVDGSLSEEAFQGQVEDLAEIYGWLLYHTHDSRRSHRGFPDLVLVRAGELIVAELKTARGRVRPEQQAWLDALALVPHVEVFLWRPADFAAIHERLRRPSPATASARAA